MQKSLAELQTGSFIYPITINYAYVLLIVKKTDLSPYLQGIYFSGWEDKLSKYINE